MYAELARDLFTGSASAAWATRSARTRKLLEAVYGPRPELREDTPLGRPRPIVAPAAARQRLGELVFDIARHVMAGRFSKVSRYFDDTMWVLWPDNHLVCHAGDDVRFKLADRPNPLGIEPAGLKSYAGAEAKAAFARGVPEALDALFPLSSHLIYTFDAQRFGRVLFAVRPTEQSCRLASLFLPSVDDAWCFSVRTSLDEEPPLRIAQNLVRRAVLGHFAGLQAMALDVMPTMWVQDQTIPREHFVAAAGAGPHRLEGGEQIFGASTPLDGDPAETIGGPLLKTIEGAAETHWHTSFEALRPRWVQTPLATIDPESLGVGGERQVVTLVLRTLEEDGTGDERVRWRVGGWFEVE